MLEWRQCVNNTGNVPCISSSWRSGEPGRQRFPCMCKSKVRHSCPVYLFMPSSSVIDWRWWWWWWWYRLTKVKYWRYCLLDIPAVPKIILYSRVLYWGDVYDDVLQICGLIVHCKGIANYMLTRLLFLSLEAVFIPVAGFATASLTSPKKLLTENFIAILIQNSEIAFIHRHKKTYDIWIAEDDGPYSKIIYYKEAVAYL